MHAMAQRLAGDLCAPIGKRLASGSQSCVAVTITHRTSQSWKPEWSSTKLPFTSSGSIRGTVGLGPGVFVSVQIPGAAERLKQH